LDCIKSVYFKLHAKGNLANYMLAWTESPLCPSLYEFDNLKMFRSCMLILPT
jgi:hypothetical protein